MQDLLEYIVKNLVSEPDAVLVEQTNDNGIINLELTVDPKDMGMIIGKGGQTIHALRKILTIRAITENVRVNLHLNEPAGGVAGIPNPESDEKQQPAKEPEIETNPE